MKSGMGFPSKSIGDKYSRAGCVYVGGGSRGGRLLVESQLT